MSPSVKSPAVFLMALSGVLLVLALAIPITESLDWPRFPNAGYVALLLAFASALCGALGAWLRQAGPRAAARARALTHLTFWLAMPLAFAGCVVQGAMHIWEARQRMNEA